MTTFTDLKVGAEFDLGIDADGHEPFYIKIAGGEAFDVAHSRRDHIEPDTVVYPTGRFRRISIEPTDIERVAVTLLTYDTRAKHPALVAWIEAIATNPDEQRYLSLFTWETPGLCDRLWEFGYRAPNRRYDQEANMFSLIWNGDGYPTPHPGYEPGEWSHIQANDRALLALAAAIADYRRSGRLDGNTSHKIMGMGSPLLCVTTSLAVAVNEFHQRVIQNIHQLYRYS